MDRDLKEAGGRSLEVVRRVWLKTQNDRILNRAAELAFWLLPGSFPMAVSVVSIAALFQPMGGSGGGKGALLGGLLGAGAGTGVAAATGRQPAEFAAESVYNFRLTASAHREHRRHRRD